MLADLTGDGRADIIGFGDGGVWVSLNQGDGTFREPTKVLSFFGARSEAGGWTSARHIRTLADLTGDGRPDIVGFGEHGVWVALNNGDGTFQQPVQVLSQFGASSNAGGWLGGHPRMLADLNGDGRRDILGFANAGVITASRS
ncbi:MAG: VCBS repeat-containing protein [Nannocystis sp.]|jgi:predicted metal-binding protein|nr:VCBS repeat-containing protein [Nannocystis sp.]